MNEYIKQLENELIELYERLNGKQAEWTPKPGEYAWDQKYGLIVLIDLRLSTNAWLVRVPNVGTRWVKPERLSEPLFVKLLQKMRTNS